MPEIYIEETPKFKLIAFLINLFLVFGILFIPEFESGPHLPEWYNKIDFYLSLVFAVPLVWQTRMLFTKTGLKLSPAGIEENTSQIQPRQFAWKHISNIKFMKMFFLKYVLIYIDDPVMYMKNQIFYKRFFMQANLKKFGTPIKIPIHSIDKPLPEIAKIVDNYLQTLFPPEPPPTPTDAKEEIV